MKLTARTMCFAVLLCAVTVLSACKANQSENIIPETNADSVTDAENPQTDEEIQPLRELTASGECQDGLTWELYSDGELTVSGTGFMSDFEKGNAAWSKHISDIKTLKVNEGVQSIGKYAFFGCYNLTSVELPQSLVGIYDFSFTECTKLSRILLPSGLERLGGGVFSQCTSLENMVLPQNITEIPPQLFYKCTSLKDVTFPKNAKYISDSAFEDCTALTGVYLPDTLTSIGNFAFCGCTDLEYAELSSGLLNIGSHAFMNCEKLTGLVLPQSVQTVDYTAFSGCTLLSDIEIDTELLGLLSDTYENITEKYGTPQKDWYSGPVFVFNDENFYCAFAEYGTRGDYDSMPEGDDVCYVLCCPYDRLLTGLEKREYSYNELLIKFAAIGAKLSYGGVGEMTGTCDYVVDYKDFSFTLSFEPEYELDFSKMQSVVFVQKLTVN